MLNNSISNLPWDILNAAKAVLDETILIRDEIKQLLQVNNKPQTSSIGDYITEDEAKKTIGRKATWFWKMRKSGDLPFVKVGSKVFYARKDLEALLDNNKSESYR